MAIITDEADWIDEETWKELFIPKTIKGTFIIGGTEPK